MHTPIIGSSDGVNMTYSEEWKLVVFTMVKRADANRDYPPICGPNPRPWRRSLPLLYTGAWVIDSGSNWNHAMQLNNLSQC